MYFCTRKSKCSLKNVLKYLLGMQELMMQVVLQSLRTNSLLVISLELVSLEKLINFRQVVVRELHSEQFPVLNEFEALYAYKCGLFEECLEMCRNHVNMLLRAGCSRNQLYPIAVPQFVSMLDGELVSLSGIVRIMHPVLFLLLVQVPDYEWISVLTLSLYLSLIHI